MCNLLVVATYLYRVLKRKKRRMSSDTTEKEDSTVDNSNVATRQQMTLTTVDLLFSTQSEDDTSVATVP